MALFGLGGLGGMRQQQGNPQQQGGGILGSSIPRISSFLGMEGEDAQSAVRRQHFLNGFRTQVGQIPEFGEGVPEAAAQGFKMQQIKQENVQQEQERTQAADAKAKLAEVLKQQLPANLHSLADANPEAAMTIWKQMNPNSDPQSLMNVGGGLIFDPNTREWIKPPEDIMPSEPAVDFDDVTTIRKEIQQLPTYKNYAQALPIYNAMSEAAGRDSRASDLNLVYGLGKIMDPTSVVREGEMVMVQNTSSLPDWLVGQINALNGGATLRPETRAAIMQEAYGRMSSYDTAIQADIGQYRDMASRYNINEADIIPALGTFTAYEPDKPSGPRTTSTGVNWSF